MNLYAFLHPFYVFLKTCRSVIFLKLVFWFLHHSEPLFIVSNWLIVKRPNGDSRWWAVLFYTFVWFCSTFQVIIVLALEQPHLPLGLSNGQANDAWSWLLYPSGCNSFSFVYLFSENIVNQEVTIFHGWKGSFAPTSEWPDLYAGIDGPLFIFISVK